LIVTSLLDLAISTLEVSLAVVLAAAAVEKLMDPAAWMRTLGNYRVAWLRRAQVANAVPLIELIVAAGLAFDVAVARVGAFVLFIGFAAVLLLALSRGASGACSCFGVVAQSQIDPRRCGTRGCARPGGISAGPHGRGPAVCRGNRSW